MLYWYQINNMWCSGDTVAGHLVIEHGCLDNPFPVLPREAAETVEALNDRPWFNSIEVLLQARGFLSYHCSVPAVEEDLQEGTFFIGIPEKMNIHRLFRMDRNVSNCLNMKVTRHTTSSFQADVDWEESHGAVYAGNVMLDGWIGTSSAAKDMHILIGLLGREEFKENEEYFIAATFGEYSPFERSLRLVFSTQEDQMVPDTAQKRNETVGDTTFEVVDCPNGITAMSFSVTNELYESVMNQEAPSEVKLSELELLAAAGGSTPGGQLRDYPITNVSWFEAAEMANELSRAQGLEPAYTFTRNERNVITEATIIENANGWRMPTVEEWRVLAAAGEDHKYPGSNNPDEVAWHSGNSGNKIHRVGELKPNAWGLYDMAGNAWEWTNTMKR